MKIRNLIGGGLLAVLLAGCQHTTPVHERIPLEEPLPPTITGTAVPQQPVATAAVNTSHQQRANAVITIHLAQAQAEPKLMQVDVGGDPLYALPQPVLTQAHIRRVSPVNTTNQGSFLLLEMNEAGSHKLRNVTAQAQGYYFLLSVQGQLVSLAQIDATIADGGLLMSTQNPQQTQAILNLMRQQ